MASPHTPLADRLRPQTLAQVVGQRHLLADDAVFRRALSDGLVPNMVFYGPSGCGKTTVARIVAANSGMLLHKLNGTSASTGDIRDVMKDVGTFGSQNGVLLYLDEIQYLNKKQQQSLLEYIEDGSVTLIASTTENPYFYVYGALLSRSTVFEFKPLGPDDVYQGLNNALARLKEEEGLSITAEDGALQKLATGSGGDMRKALNSLEFALGAAENGGDGHKRISLAAATQVAQRGSMRYDRGGDEHYDTISAYQKSMRGSDPNAALHYLARLLEADDLPSACRRLLVTASEDVGLAYPQILPIVKAAVDTALQLGLPEGAFALANAVLLVALAPKSTSASAVFAAWDDVKNGKAGPIPRILQNKHYDGADAVDPGQHYVYPHKYPGHWVHQQYLPDNLADVRYYSYGDNKTEQAFKDYWDKVKNK